MTRLSKNYGIRTCMPVVRIDPPIMAKQEVYLSKWVSFPTPYPALIALVCSHIALAGQPVIKSCFPSSAFPFFFSFPPPPPQLGPSVPVLGSAQFVDPRPYGSGLQQHTYHWVNARGIIGTYAYLDGLHENSVSVNDSYLSIQKPTSITHFPCGTHSSCCTVGN
jgi:hypothetical protein